MTISVIGIQALEMRLAQIEEELLAAATAAAAVDAGEVALTAQALCPVESGELKSSITASVSDTPYGVRLSVAAGASHAGYVEHGTSKTPARPFLYPTIKIYQGKIRRKIEAAVRGAV